MTENKQHSGGIPKGAFRPEVHIINPATKRESAEEAAHDYMRRNIGPSVGTIADRLETAFLAGAQWALTHNPADSPSSAIEQEARISREATCVSTHDGWVCTREKGHSGRHVASAFALWGTAYDVWEEEE